MNTELHNRLFAAASELILPFVEYDLAEPPVDASTRQQLTRACDMLDRVLQIEPRNQPAIWCRGIAHKVLRNLAEACGDFRLAYAMDDDELCKLESGRQLGCICIALGQGTEAAAITADVLARSPNDPGLIANHALALLIAGQIEDAQHIAERALRLNPDGRITHDLLEFVAGVRSGSVPRPTCWPPV
jgi:tetratricopeptide (TPR) repeat protein